MTYREVIYEILDLSKLLNDDITLNEEHVMFLLDKVRANLLWQKYKSLKEEIPESNYQMLCLDLEERFAIDGSDCEGPHYLWTTKKLPKLMTIGNPIVYPLDFYQGYHINLVSRERMRYVGDNKYLRNIIYCSINPDGHLYFKSNNPQFLYLEKVKMVAIFENPAEAAELQCDADCDVFDSVFPLEESLVITLIDACVKEIVGASLRPADQKNDANDELSDLAIYLAKNSKSALQKQIEA